MPSTLAALLIRSDTQPILLLFKLGVPEIQIWIRQSGQIYSILVPFPFESRLA